MFDNPERLALGAKAPSQDSQQCVEQCPEASRRQIPNDDGYGAHGKIPSFYSNQAAQMGRLGGSSKDR